jgi:hypothetical protein
VRLALPGWRELEAIERRHARIVERTLDQVAGDAVGYEPRLQVLPAAIAVVELGARRWPT